MTLTISYIQTRQMIDSPKALCPNQRSLIWPNFQIISLTQKKKEKNLSKVIPTAWRTPQGSTISAWCKPAPAFLSSVQTRNQHHDPTFNSGSSCSPKKFLHCDKNRNKLVFASPSSENTTSLCRILIACTGQSCTSALIVYFFNLVYKKHSPRYKFRKFWFCALLGFYIAWAVILICGCILSWCMFLL